MRPGRPRSAWALLSLVLSLGSGPAVAAVAAEVTEAKDVTAVGRGVSVSRPVSGSVIAVLGDVRLESRVTGDVIVLGGDVLVAPGGRVDGDLLCLGGGVRFEGTSADRAVGGRLRTLAAVEAALLAEVETSPARGLSVSPLLVGLRIGLLLLWLSATLALVFFLNPLLSRARGVMASQPLLAFGVGATSVLAGLMGSGLLVTLLPPSVSMLLFGAVLAALGTAKLLGMAALFGLSGRWLLARFREDIPRIHPLGNDLAASAVGLLALGGISLMPVIGALVWGTASVLAIGASISLLAE